MSRARQVEEAAVDQPVQYAAALSKPAPAACWRCTAPMQSKGLQAAVEWFHCLTCGAIDCAIAHTAVGAGA